MNSLKSKVRVEGEDYGAPYEVHYRALWDVGVLKGNSFTIKRRKRLEAAALKYSFKVYQDLRTITFVGVVDSVDKLKELALEVSDFSTTSADYVLGPIVRLWPQEGKETRADIYHSSYSLEVFSPEELRYLYGLKAQNALSDSVNRLLL